MSKGRSEPKILPVGIARAQLPHADSTGSLGDGLRNGVFRDDRLLLVGGQAGSTHASGKIPRVITQLTDHPIQTMAA